MDGSVESAARGESFDLVEAVREIARLLMQMAEQVQALSEAEPAPARKGRAK